MNEQLAKLWKEAEETGKPIDIGEIVVCDWCNEDYSDSNEVGGFLFGSYGTCPKCAVRMMPKIIAYNEQSHIVAIAGDGETFREFSLRMRGGNNTIHISRLGGDADAS